MDLENYGLFLPHPQTSVTSSRNTNPKGLQEFITALAGMGELGVGGHQVHLIPPPLGPPRCWQPPQDGGTTAAVPRQALRVFICKSKETFMEAPLEGSFACLIGQIQSLALPKTDGHKDRESGRLPVFIISVLCVILTRASRQGLETDSGAISEIN